MHTESKEETQIRNRYNQIPHLTQNTIWERKHHIQESKEVSPFLAGDHKAAINRQGNTTDKHETNITKKIHKRSTALGQTVKKYRMA